MLLRPHRALRPCAGMQRGWLRRAIPCAGHRALSTSPSPPSPSPPTPPPPSPPSPPSPSSLGRDILLSGTTSFVGIGACTLIHYSWLPSDYTMVLGSMGASAVLLYAAPSVPFSQPRNLFGGHLASCAIGVSCHELISVPMGSPVLAAPVAVSAAIMLMKLTKTVHPPAGGTCLIAVLGSAQLHDLGYQLLIPTASGAAILYCVALANNLAGVKYPA